uniref:Farnesol dehydrogenase-like n=1 Tax=Photinus pyralis TaxID=7054 RepID=A0A1Y1MA80_PHOPY
MRIFTIVIMHYHHKVDIFSYPKCRHFNGAGIMNRWYNKVAVVTGASSGIGAATVSKLVDSGLRVVGLARRKERLTALQKTLEGRAGTFFPIVADVSKEQDVLDAFNWVTQNVDVIHVLVNCAGVMPTSSLLDGETSQWKEILDTNLLGMCITTREAIKIMRENKIDGHVVHIKSVGGQRVPCLPDLSVYPASKFGVTALTETLRQELNAIGSKIKISSVSPGVVNTELVPEGKLLNIIKAQSALQPEDIAEAVAYILGTPPHVQVNCGNRSNQF